MRILYIDVDTLRADHLGCYGYPRNTSPNIDQLAQVSVRFDNCYVSDAPCLPSRTALFSGRFGIQTGVINHGGSNADYPADGPDRGFFARITGASWPSRIRRAGLRTVTISSFAERHSAYHALAGFSEAYNVGMFGQEQAHDVTPIAEDWLDRRGQEDDWFLHVHYWDPHTPYRVPADYGDPFETEPHPDWITEAIREKHWQGAGPHSAQEVTGFSSNEEAYQRFPRQPTAIDSMAKVRAMFDGYDTGIRYTDDHVGLLLDKLRQLGIYEDTVIILSADHGETLGELNIYGDHQVADQQTSHVPLLIKWPGVTTGSRVDTAFHYQFDMAATVLEMLDAPIPSNWDGQSFAEAFMGGKQSGRDHLILSQGAWSCQRSIRFDQYICLRSYHDGFHDFPDVMLFNVEEDPHEQLDLAAENPALVGKAMLLLDGWLGDNMSRHSTGIDPMWQVIREGGPFHCKGQLPAYLERLQATGRSHMVEKLKAKHGG